MYTTLALEKEREIVKEETALRKEKAVMLYKDVYNRIYTGSRDGLENHMHTYTCTCSCMYYNTSGQYVCVLCTGYEDSYILVMYVMNIPFPRLQ